MAQAFGLAPQARFGSPSLPEPRDYGPTEIRSIATDSRIALQEESTLS